MGTSYTPTILRGLLVPDPRFLWDAGLVSVTSQAGPMPGVPEAQVESELVPQATGSTAPDSELRFLTSRGGHPGDGARFVWRYSSEGSDDWRGWDPPVSLSGWEAIDWTSTAGQWAHPHALALADGTIVVASCKSNRRVTVKVRNPGTGAWVEVEVYDQGTTYAVTSAHPCLVQLPSGRLLCIFWREHGTNIQLRTYISDDSGTSWVPGQKGCLSSPIDSTAYIPGRIRAAYLLDQVALIGHVQTVSSPEDQIWQWASDDLGTTFDSVSQLTGHDRAYPDVVTHNNTLVVVYISETASSGSSYPAYCRVIGSAYESLDDAQHYLCQPDSDSMDWGNQSSGVFANGEVALWSDEDGRLWVIGRDHATAENELMTRTSEDGGVSWVDPGTGPAAADGVATWRARDLARYPEGLAACAHRGRAFLAHQPGATTTYAPSLCGFWLGGYTSVCLAQEAASEIGPLTVAGFTHTYVPYDYPEATGSGVPVWTRSTSTGTRALTLYGLHLTTAAGQAERYDASPSGTSAQGITAVVDCRHEAGTGLLQLRLYDGTTNTYEVAVWVTDTSISLRDVGAGSEIASVSTTDADGAAVQILIDMRNNDVTASYRPVNASGDRKWTLIGTTGSLTPVAASSTNRLRFGQGESSETYWRLVEFSSDSYTERGIYGQDNWSDLLGRSYMPTPVWLDGGLHLQAIDGPTFRNDWWKSAPVFSYPISAVFPDVAGSPRRPWRSTTDTVQQDIEITLGDVHTYLMGSLASVFFGDTNFGTAELHGQDNAGVWTNLGTLDRRIQTGLAYGRSDRMIRPTSAGGTTVANYLHRNILEGSYFAMSDGGEGKVVRRISTNEPGIWNPSLSSLQTRILLEEVDNTEPTSATDGELWSKDSTHVVPITTRYKKLRIRIPAQDTAEGYFRIGTLLIGHMVPIGGYLQQYGWGRVVDWAYDYETVEGQTGIRTVRELGPARRAAEVSWVDGVETTGLTEADPSWILGWAGGQAVAVPADVPWSMPGLIERLRGAKTPLVYLPAFSPPPNGSTIVHITDRTRQLYGRVVSEQVGFKNVVGDEGATEVLRLGVVRIDEEV